MALPNPTTGIPPNAPSSNAPNIGDVKFDIKEAIQTGLKGGFLGMQQSFFSKVPKILGGGVLAERAELKKRELFEKQGRDPTTGRKLTREELEERALRKRSYGIMGDISDSVQEIQRILESGSIFGGAGRRSAALGSITDLGKKTELNIEQPKDGDGYELAPERPPSPSDARIEPTEETKPYDLMDEGQTGSLAKEEQKLEDQEAEKEQKIEIQERNEEFFVKLFERFFGKKGESEKPNAAKEDGSSIFSKIASAVDFISDAKSLGGGRLLGKAGRMIGIGRGAAGTASVAAQGAGAAAQGANTATSAGKGFFGKAFDFVKSGASKAVGKVGEGLSAAKSYAGKGLTKVGEVASKLNPIKALKSGVGKIAPKILKSAVALPGIGAAMEAIIGGIEISNLKSDPMMSPEEKKEKIGLAIGKTLGSILGTIGGGALGSLIPIPVVGTLVGSMGGAYVGGLAGEAIAEALGGKGIYDVVSSIPLLGDLVKVEEYPTPETAIPANAAEMGIADNVMVPTSSAAEPGAGITPASTMPAVPATTPTSAVTLTGLGTENAMLKTPQSTPQVAVAASNTVVNQSNNAAVMSALSTTRTGADLNDVSLLRNQLGLAF